MLSFAYRVQSKVSVKGVILTGIPTSSPFNMARFFLYEEALREELLENERERRIIRMKPLRSLTDIEMIKDYRVNRIVFEKICEMIVPLLPMQKNSRGIDPVRKILTALNFYARGSYQGSVGRDDLAPMAQQTVSRCLNEVTNAFNDPNVIKQTIRFPQSRQERNTIKRGFFEIYGIPGVCGCIDCTHIAIVKPTENEERYFNRKNYHSLNVQMICDHKNKILNVDCRYGGATHDSFIWQNSPILPHFEGLTAAGERAILLGDSGYPLRNFMMIPVENAAQNSPEEKYNQAQKKARSTIERTFGILKGRWRCLLAARELHYQPEKAAKITVACAILHNMCIDAGVDELEPLNESEIVDEANRQPIPARPAVSVAVGLQEGRNARQQIINLFI